MQYFHGADLKIKHARSLEDEDMEEDDIALPSSQSPAKDKNVHSKEDNGHANGDDEMLSPRKDEGLEIEGGKASTGKVRDCKYRFFTGNSPFAQCSSHSLIASQSQHSISTQDAAL